MYQSIDDIEAETDHQARRSIGFAGVVSLAALALAILVAAILWFSPDRSGEPGDPLQPEPVARAAYLQAIGETDPALRRARLRDFINQNPENPRAPAAQAQLYVLDAAEARAWQDTVSAAYDTTRPQTERLAVLDAFQDKWGRFLGGRDEEVQTLRAEIEQSADAPPKPDRSLPDGPSPFPSTVPDGQLAGGPATGRPVQPVITGPPVTIVPQPVRPVAEIIPPKERRRVTPRYPRQAARRGVEGRVTLSLNIDERGRVAMTEVITVEADRYARDFVRAAERAAMRTRFHPKTIDGEPVPAVGVRKTYRFEN